MQARDEMISKRNNFYENLIDLSGQLQNTLQKVLTEYSEGPEMAVQMLANSNEHFDKIQACEEDPHAT